MAQSSDKASSLWRFFSFSPYAALATDESGTTQLQPNVGQILRSKRFRFVLAASLVALVVLFFIFSPQKSLNFDYIYNPFFSEPPVIPNGVDWSRFAYTQYATNMAYLCNSVMLFETLHRLGSKADRLLMYPNTMQADPTSDSAESKLLLKAQNEYGVKLQPIEVQHRGGGDPTWADSYTKLLAFNQTQYDRVLSLDSDSTVLQPMDELFLAPAAPVAMPRAYWLGEPTLSSQMVLIQPTKEEFTRVKNAIDNAKGGDFDMEIVNNLYGKDCLIIPHRRYDLLTGEFRSSGDHVNYIGNEYEVWDPDKMLQEAKFLHFSDWPMPKPWLPAPPNKVSEWQPKCQTDSTGAEDCRNRDLWLGFYSDFKDRRRNVCNIEVSKVKARSEEIRPRGRYEYDPRA